MSQKLISANIDNLKTWVKYKKGLCDSCRGTCCSLPVEVKFDDLARMGVADPFEVDEPAKKLAKRLTKAGVIQHFNFKTETYTLSQRSNDDCVYLDQKTRLCTIYQVRPDTCRNHPQIGPRPNHCAYQTK
ncbi:YkgJ family cysteine cluster protein [Marinobacterium jannaschii]|uniref:YkgJ family cysteine cluster protein n=1 Tax=Marinobacterium jannaschii TaxID=64970 RepID=UPI000482FE34|nr:YkgJ family cysteine cluster protein [Marinobacterium jannaschii]